MRCVRLSLSLAVLLSLGGPTTADGPGDNLADKVRPIPPKGVAVPDADRTALQEGLDRLAQDIADLRLALKDKPALPELLPDVQVYHHAVRYALSYDEFFNVKA